MILYHYTSKESAEQIKASGVIIASSPKMDGSSGSGGRFGRGVYLTTIEPNTWLTPGRSKRDIANANYGSGGEKNLRAGKVDWYVRLEMPEDRVIQVHGRVNTYVFPDDILLHNYPSFKIGECHEWTAGDTMLVGAAAAIGIALIAGALSQESRCEGTFCGEISCFSC